MVHGSLHLAAQVWSALSIQTKARSINPLGLKRKKKKKGVIRNVEEEEDADDRENLSIPTCCALLYSIATNDMNKLDGVLKFLAPIAKHLDAPPKRGGTEELIAEQLLREKKARANTVRLVKGKSKQNRTCPVLKLIFFFLLPSFFSSFLL